MLTNISNKGKRAFIVPVFLCLITLFAPVKDIVEWAEVKALDLLFCFNYGTEQSPVLILNKDQAFDDRFHKALDRSDFASLLQNLKKLGAEVVAFDFLFGEANDQAFDNQFVKSLKEFPFPILAQHFVSRKRRGYSKLMKSSTSSRSPWPVKIYAPFSDASAGKGLVNVFPELDGAIRYIPLAFLPEEKLNYIPSLGFISWISHEISHNLGHQLLQIIKTSQILITFESILKNPKWERRTLGHKGLDKLALDLETKLILRFVLYSLKGTAELSNDELNKLKITISSNLQSRSWINFPTSPLPLIGPDFAPCLRIPFQKSNYSQTGDHIESLSISTFLKTKSEIESSDQLVSRNLFRPENIKSTNPVFSFNLVSSTNANGKIEGEIRTVTGQTVVNADVFISSEITGFWAITKTDKFGLFILEKIPTGSYNLEIIANYNACKIKSSLLAKVNMKATSSVKITLDTMPELSSYVKLDGTMPTNTNLVMFGEPLNIFKTNKMGKIDLSIIPDNHSLEPLSDEYDEVCIVSGTVLLPSGKPLSLQNVALLEQEEIWKHSFFSRVSSKNINASDYKVKVPYALDCQTFIEGLSASASQTTTLDLEVLPNKSDLKIDRIPTLKADRRKIRFTPRIKEGSEQAKFIFIDQENNQFECQNGAEILLKSGPYRVFLEDQSFKGIFNKFKTNLGNRAIFIGTSLDEDQDFVITPINFMDRSNSRLPGVNLHANLCSALLQKRFLVPVFFHFDYSPKYWIFIVSLLLFPIMLFQCFIFSRKGAFAGGLVSCLISIIWVVVAVVEFKAKVLVPIVFPISQILCFAITLSFIAWAISRQKERETRNTFGRFISPAMVTEILHNPKALKPGGEKKELTIMFTDLAGFTTISEKLIPEKLTELMNEYLDEMTNILFKYHGTLDKYIGDAIMGFWNHPNKLESHPQLAAECAIEMQLRLSVLQKKWIERGLPALSMRVGLNTATCMVGFIGSKTQMNFTCLGDGVNLAARLEGANKPYGTLMMISDTVNNSLDHKKIRTRFLDFLAVKGKIKPVKVYELIGYTSVDEELWAQIMPLYNKAHKYYLKQKWVKAIKLFSEVLVHNPNDGLSQTYIGRCEYFKSSPPPENWDGRFILKTK